MQVAHAVANLAFQTSKGLDPRAWGEFGPNFVVYGVSDERALLEIERLLGPSAVSFREPDLGDHLTAIAYMGPPLPGFVDFALL